MLKKAAQTSGIIIQIHFY